MSAPRLLDKRTVNAEVATQKTQQIKEGLALAKKVDALRETLQEEQGNVDNFRKETLLQIQREIDTKIAERNFLQNSNEILRQEHIKLQAPIDLTQEWEQARRATLENKHWEERNIDFQVSLIARESECLERENALILKETEAARANILSNRTLEEAEKSFTEADKTLANAKLTAHALLSEAKIKERDIRLREQDIDTWNSQLTQREKEVKEHEIDLANREESLKVRYETFIKAQNYIKNKK